MNECIAYDDDGSIMTLYRVNTISPIKYAQLARELAFFHLEKVDCAFCNDVNAMLPDILYDKVTGEATHIMCSRNGYDNTIRNQQATMLAESLNGSDWISDVYFYLEDNPDVDLVKSKMCFILGDMDKVLEYLGLEKK